MPKYIPGAEPFYFPGNHVGCLLIHGFTGTPFEMRELGERLASRSYTVLGPTLAGHATTIDDILQTRWTDWHASTTAAYNQLRETCDAIFPIGLSLGALLALHLAAHRQTAGVVSISAPFSIKNPLIPLFKFIPLLFDLVPAVQKNPRDDDTLDPTVRTHHPEYAAHLRDDLRDICVPTLLIQSHGDRTIPANSMNEFYARIASREKEMVWLDQSGHLVLEDYSKEIAFARILRFVETYARSTCA